MAPEGPAPPPGRPGPGRSLRARLLASHLAVTLLALATVVFLAVTALERSALAQRREALLGHGRVVAGVSAQYMVKGHDYLEHIARDYGAQVGARVLILGADGQVLRDSFYDPALLGARLTHQEEIRAALGGREATRLQRLPGVGRTLYAAVPIRDRGQVVGAVLIAQAVEPVWAELAPVRRVLWLVSALALAVAGVAAWVLAGSIARPVRALTEAVQAVAAGDLSRRVPAGGGDELGRLAAAFNAMAEQLARVEESRRAFVANAAHELRTPLAALRALVEPLLSGAVTDPAEQAEFLRDIGQEVDRLSELAGDLLTLNELEAGRPLTRGPVDVGELVGAVCARLGPLAREQGVRLRAEAPGGLVVYADGLKLERAVYNLVHNGIRYNRPGGEVAVTARAGGGRVQVEVADQGPGIAPEDLPRIFERLYRTEPSRSRDRGGAGLGLAIAREIAEAHGGTIRVESRLGEGSRFVLEIPIRPAG